MTEHLRILPTPTPVFRKDQYLQDHAAARRLVQIVDLENSDIQLPSVLHPFCYLAPQNKVSWFWISMKMGISMPRCGTVSRKSTELFHNDQSSVRISEISGQFLPPSNHILSLDAISVPSPPHLSFPSRQQPKKPTQRCLSSKW